MFLNVKKINFQLLVPIVCVFFSIIFILKVHPESILVSDNLTKISQAQAFVDSGFQSEYSSCAVLRDLGGCSYFHDGDGNSQKRIVGVFPVAISLFAAIFGWFGDYSPLYFIALGFCFLGVFLLKFRSGMGWWGVFLLIFGPCFFHSVLFPDYSITFFLTALFVSYYDKPSSKTWINALVGIGAGSVVFFRPENILLPFFLGILQFADTIRKRNLLKNHNDKNHWILLLGSGLAILLFGLVNYYLYDSVIGTRIAGNANGILTHKADNRVLSLLFFGNGRVGFLLFSPWIVLGFLLLLLKFRFLEKKEKFLLSASLASFVSVVLLAPNDSNIDWGTRYLSWISVPVVFLFFTGNSNSILLSFGRKIRITAVALFTFSLAIFFSFFLIQARLSEEFLKYNSWFKNQKTDVAIMFEPSLEALHGQEILRRKVLLPNREQNLEELVKFLTSKSSKVDLIRYEPSTQSLVDSIRSPELRGVDYRLEKEFIRQGWRPISKQVLERVEIVTLAH